MGYPAAKCGMCWCLLLCLYIRPDWDNDLIHFRWWILAIWWKFLLDKILENCSFKNEFVFFKQKTCHFCKIKILRTWLEFTNKLQSLSSWVGNGLSWIVDFWMSSFSIQGSWVFSPKGGNSTQNILDESLIHTENLELKVLPLRKRKKGPS